MWHPDSFRPTAAPREWRHRFLPLEAAAAEVDPGGGVIALWQSQRSGRLLPPWSAFDMTDFRPWLGYVSVDRVSYDPFDCTNRLWGSALVGLYGFEATDRSLRQDYELRGMTPGDFAFWERVATTPCLGIGEGTVDWQNRDFISLTRVFLPFAENGTTTDVIVAVAFPKLT